MKYFILNVTVNSKELNFKFFAPTPQRAVEVANKSIHVKPFTINSITEVPQDVYNLALHNDINHYCTHQVKKTEFSSHMSKDRKRKFRKQKPFTRPNVYDRNEFKSFEM